MKKHSPAFTLVELVIVIAVLGILAGVTVIGYGKWRESVAKKEVQSDLQMAAAAMENAKNFGSGYPTDGNIPSSFRGSEDVTVSYHSGTADTFCIDGTSKTNTSVHYYIDTTKGKQLVAGVCTFPDGTPIQTITSTNCPEDRIRAVDARDNHTYWVQKLADGKCWMLTNLAYAGGGANTYGDVKTLVNGTNLTVSYFEARYYIPPAANPTTDPTNPSTSTDGGATGTQYGYLYHFCSANGGQLGNGACSNSSNIAAIQSISVCPAGWRLPTGNGGEFGALNNAINFGSTNAANALYSVWLGQRSGAWSGSGNFYNQGSWGYYWSSSQYSTNNVYAYGLIFSNSSVQSAYDTYKYVGYAVRCVAM